MVNGINSTVVENFRQPSKIWFPYLHEPLTSHTWQRMENHGFDIKNYRTHRWLEKNSTAECVVPATLDLDLSRSLFCRIEVLPKSSRLRFQSHGLVFPNPNYEDRYLPIIQSALAIIATVPCLYTSVSAYLRILHILQAPSREFDVSHSDPDLPFTIFVSVPTDGQFRSLRLAESIIHECMHLQLTLIESVVPLVADPDSYIYSPWRRTPRPLGGVLHGMYVFTVIHGFFDELRVAWPLQPVEEEYVIDRQTQITEEILKTACLSNADGLTPAGQLLTGSVLQMFEH